MPTAFPDQRLDGLKRGKTIKTAYDSETFDADGKIHVEGLVGSATISPSGRDIALASPEGLAIIDLDSPYSPPRRLSSHGLPWLVVDVQWSPFAARDYWVASTANHRCLVWNLNLRDDSSNGAIEHSLQGHSRAITDINFSAHHPDILATCAVDGYVHSWDLRKPQQPALSFCDWFSGATQVKYNRQDPHILASSHDRLLHIWDERKAAVPVRSIDAHTSKIYGLDWNRTSPTQIVTCSLDKSIKFWDFATSDEPTRIIRTDFPVWRARHTPFGRGVLAMPQNDPGNLYLYDSSLREGQALDGPSDPVNVFPGHGSSKVREFLWRSRGTITDDCIDNRDFQLVSWGEDNQLLLHHVEPRVFESVGHDIGGPAQKKLIMTRKGATYKTYRAVDDHSNRDSYAAKMRDHRPGSGGRYRRSALTVGMQSLSTKYNRSSTAPSWRGPAMKARSSNAKRRDRHRDQLGWMKGITMSRKRSAPVGSPQRTESKDTSLFSPNFHGSHWAEPENLQEELVRVSQQLPNVNFYNIDMDSLDLNASLNGPWGADGNTIYMEVKVDVPSHYPKANVPKFVIEKTAHMTDQTCKKLNQEVANLASQFSQRQQNCLEVIFSYLLGETDLSSSDTFFKNVKDLDDDLDALADESSSEDEDGDIPAGGSAALSGELTASVELDQSLAPAHRPILPPLPILCGGRFSNNGKLVCFFPTKEEKAARALLFAPSEASKEKSKGEPTFAGFGRLHQDSTPPRRRYMNDDGSGTDDQSDSDESDSSSSSSNSETTYGHKVNMWYLPGRRFRKTFSSSHSVHSSGGGTGTGIGTGTGTGTTRRRYGRPKNIISLHNVAPELPSQKEFAHEYIIFGDGATICYQNAKVAQKHGRPDLVDVWKYAALLLRKDIPLELLCHDQSEDSVLVIARNALDTFGDATPTSDDLDDSMLSGRVKWGHHPLAKDLINDLFIYFERIADIQMLAMLSCVFGGSSTSEGVEYAESHLTQPETPLTMKAPAFSLEYFPPDAYLWPSRYRSQAASLVSTPKVSQTPVHVVGSFGSESGMWAGDPGSNSYSCGETPPSRTPRDHLSEGDPTQSLSTSPNNQLLRRANTALSSASSFAANFSRPFASVASTSPPTRKRPSPGEALGPGLGTVNVTWGASTILGPTSEPPATARNSVSDDEPRRDEGNPFICYGISSKVEDQSVFDDDGWLVVPLLEPSREAYYANYRYAYAEMLLMWGQPLARLEIMKFNILQQGPSEGTSLEAFPDSTDQAFHDVYQPSEQTGHTSHPRQGASSTIPLGKKETLQSLLVSSGRGIDVTGLCRIHETKLEPVLSRQSGTTVGGAVGLCERCNRTQSQLLCVYCNEPVDALYPPCLSCGCASHGSCLAEWFSAGETECPAGDECNCMDQASDGLVETWMAMMGVMRQEQERQQQQMQEMPHLRPHRHGKKGSRTTNIGSPTDTSPTREEPFSRSLPRHRRYMQPFGGRSQSHHRANLSTSSSPSNGSALDPATNSEWENVASSAYLPAADSQGKPLFDHNHTPTNSSHRHSHSQNHSNDHNSPATPLSAARISLGNRLKKSAGQWGSTTALRGGRTGSGSVSGVGGNNGGPASSGFARR